MDLIMFLMMCVATIAANGSIAFVVIYFIKKNVEKLIDEQKKMDAELKKEQERLVGSLVKMRSKQSMFQDDFDGDGGKGGLA